MTKPEMKLPSPELVRSAIEDFKIVLKCIHSILRAYERGELVPRKEKVNG